MTVTFINCSSWGYLNKFKAKCPHGWKRGTPGSTPYWGIIDSWELLRGEHFFKIMFKVLWIKWMSTHNLHNWANIILMAALWLILVCFSVVLIKHPDEMVISIGMSLPQSITEESRGSNSRLEQETETMETERETGNRNSACWLTTHCSNETFKQDLYLRHPFIRSANLCNLEVTYKLYCMLWLFL